MKRMEWALRVLVPTLLAGLAGCAVQPPVPVCPPPVAPVAAVTPHWHEARWSDLPGWPETGLHEAWPVWREDCARLHNRPDWHAACAAAETVDSESDAQVAAYFESWFSPWQSIRPDGTDRGLITGYYTPSMEGSLSRTAVFDVPLYRRPADLVDVDLAQIYPQLKGMRLRGRLDGQKLVPYWDRAQIDADPALLAGSELVWVHDPLAAFFMQIQGSGQIRLPDGRAMMLGYADQNGYPYRAIGRVLVERGELPAEQVTMQSIGAWADAHVAQLPDLLAANPAYVFFRVLPQEMPLGAAGLPVVEGRSIAVDPRAIPLGAPVWLATQQPGGEGLLQRLVYALDTGGAIRGNVRADLYFGLGGQAGEQAGRMKQAGRLWLLWPKAAQPPGENSR